MLSEQEKKAELEYLNPIQKLRVLYRREKNARVEHKLAEEKLHAHQQLRKEHEEQELKRKYAISPEEQKILTERTARLKKEHDIKKEKLRKLGLQIRNAATRAGERGLFVGQQTGKLASAIAGRPDVYRSFERDYRSLNPYSRHNPYRQRRRRR